MSLIKFGIKRGVHGILVAWASITVIFLLRFATPGDPATALIPVDAPPEARQAIREEFGLNQPIYVQYFEYITDIAQADLGYSYISRVSVNELVMNRLPATIELATAAIVITILLSIPLGVISAMNRHKFKDYAASTFALVGISTPNFWLGIMLILVMSVFLGWFPTSGREYSFVQGITMLVFDLNPNGLLTWLWYITLPAVTLGTYYVALITRLTRSEMLEQLGDEYVKVLEAKGIPETLVTFKYVLRNSLISVITVLGLMFGSLLNGAVVVEVVFRWPGMGNFLVRAISTSDWPVIQGTLIIFAIMWVLINFSVDVIYTVLDPRVGLEGEPQ